MTLQRQAALIAAHAHRNQSYGATTYFDGHLIFVAENAHLITQNWTQDERDNAVAIAFLHDSIEDKAIGESSLVRDLSLATESHNALWIAQVVKHLARSKSETYEEYIQRLCKIEPPKLKRMVLAVKGADLLANIGESPPDRLLKRYHKALGKVAIQLVEERPIMNQLLLNTQ